ncbi:MAG: zinc finger protein ZPR1 [Amphiamblys sp. WSBS2006]|nr:MAG: zinc finger protein ZPR1 [Amphiamblys sp. WSBS2006]
MLSVAESMCTECSGNGETRLYMVETPGFGKTVVSSFECSRCGNTNRDVLPFEEIQERGVVFTCLVGDDSDLRRMVLRGENAVVSVREIGVEIQPRASQATTLEGILSGMETDLREVAKAQDKTEDEKAKINGIAESLRACLEGKQPLTVRVDDPSGNSSVEAVGCPDRKMRCQWYWRTPEQTRALGIEPEPKEDVPEQEETDERLCLFPGECPACRYPCETRMSIIEIPHFREVILMSTSCDACRFRSSEVKSSGGVSEKGRRHFLTVGEEDLQRDVLKSETCRVLLPDLEVELCFGSGALGGRLTTVEGLLQTIREDMGTVYRMHCGDSAEKDKKETMERTLARLDNAIKHGGGLRLVLDDPLGASHISNPHAPLEDTRLLVEEYDRTEAQNNEF